VASKTQSNVAVIRAEVVELYCQHFQSMGAPLGRLLERAGIPPELITVSNALVPSRNAYHLAELACSSLQTEHLGLMIGRASSLQELGAYGRHLGKTPTIGAYLKQGIAYYNTLNNDERLWLSSHGAELRLNYATGSNRGLGTYQSQLFTMMLTVVTLRHATGSGWCPREVGFAYQSREPMPPAAEFAQSRVVNGCNHTYLTIPKALLRMPLPQVSADTSPVSEDSQPPVPTDVTGLVMAQVDALGAKNGDYHIDTLAESLAMSRRSLQRAIDREGCSYQQLLTRYRMDKATAWLAIPEKPVIEIALDLGYTDASNFSRAFRRHTGYSPREFRAGIERH
jgi:AraC-like DNA-binding protein